MAKFSKIRDEEPTPPPERESTISVNRANISINSNTQPQVGLAQAEIDKLIVEHQINKDEEHWVKQYWRPAMGWLYMVICACDFVIFPIFSMFMPIFIKMQYVAWKSITLDNGGLIHLSFGAILGVAAWTRGQEKIVGKN